MYLCCKLVSKKNTLTYYYNENGRTNKAGKFQQQKRTEDNLLLRIN